MKRYIRLFVEEILTWFAQLVLWRHRPNIIAITGSAGKTTTKTVIGSALESAAGKSNVLVSYGNLGSISGIPLALLSFKVNILDIPFGLGGFFLILLVPFALFKTLWLIIWPGYPKFVVLELTADRPGDFTKICRYLRPNIGVVTNVGPSHLLIFKTIEGVAKEKSTLVKYVRPDGLVLLNGQDRLVKEMAKQTRAQVGFIDVASHDFALTSAKKIGEWFNLPSDKIEQGIKEVVLPDRRFDVLRGKNDTVLIDSTYNANPISMKFELERLDKMADSRKIVILGDMLELGTEAKKYHEEIGTLAREISDYLVAVGPLSGIMPADYSTLDVKEAADNVLSVIKPGDTILIKASHGMHLELIVNQLKA